MEDSQYQQVNNSPTGESFDDIDSKSINPIKKPAKKEVSSVSASNEEQLKKASLQANTPKPTKNNSSDNTFVKSDSQITEKLIIYYNKNKMLIDNPYVKVDRKLNHHTIAYVSGFVTADLYDYYVLAANKDTKLEIRFVDNNNANKLLFKGLVSDINCTTEGVMENALYHIEISAISYTYLMDIKSNFTTFQNKDETYKNIVDNIVSKYEKGQCLFLEDSSSKLEKFTIQYQETDWEFIMRMASRFNCALLPDMSADFPRFKFGIKSGTDRGNLEKYNYKVERNIDNFRAAKVNQLVEGINELDFISYCVYFEHEKTVFEIGDKVAFHGIELYVNEIYIEIKDHNMYCLMFLTSENALKRRHYPNSKILGVSIVGQVVERAANMLKLHFVDLEEMPEIEKMWWFNYTTFYSTFYCMPDKNDFVNVYFPSYADEDAYAINSIKQLPLTGYDRSSSIPMVRSSQVNENGRKRNGISTSSDSSSDESSSGNALIDNFDTISNDPDTKFLSTKDGKRIVLRPNSIQIVFTDGTYVVLNDNDGICVHTPKNIELHANNDIDIIAKNSINVVAGTQIHIGSTGGEENGPIVSSQILMEPELITTKSEHIKMN